MTSNDDRRTDSFIDWLDAFVAGRSTPDIEVEAETELSDICLAARQFHGLDVRLEQYAVSVSPHTTSWEDIMSAHPGTLEAPGVGATDHHASRSSVSNIAHIRTWERAANALLIAALVLALAAGLWRAADNLGFGNGNQPPDGESIPFGGALPRDDNGNVDPSVLPVAEDCTVEPLTVDEVLSYIDEPFGSTAGTPAGSPDPGSEGEELSPSVTPAPPRPIARNDLEGIAQAHRMWMSCVLAESYFRVWALEDPDYVRAQVLIAIQLLDPEEQRAALKDLEANGARENGIFFPFSQRGYPGPDRIHTIIDDPENSIHDTFIYRVGYASYSPDGTLICQVSPADDGPDITMVDSCNSYLFTWNEARTTWLIYDAPNCE